MNFPKCSVKLNDYTELNIGNNIGSNLLNSLKDAGTYVNIISPCISLELVKELKKLKKNKPELDIKLLFAANEKNLEDKNNKEVFKELLEFSWEDNPEKIANKERKIKSLARSKGFSKFLFILVLLIFIITAVLNFFKPALNLLISNVPAVEKYASYFPLSNANMYITAGIFGAILLLLLIRMGIAKKTIKATESISISDPDFTKVINFKCVKSGENFKNIFPNTRMYLIDEYNLNRVNPTRRAFFGSPNFTNAGLKNNLESLIETRDAGVCIELKRFFDEMYALNLEIHSKEEIGKIIFKNEILKK